MKVIVFVSTFPSLIVGFSMSGIIRDSRAQLSSISSSTLHARPPQDLDKAFEDLKKEINDFRNDPTSDEVASKSKKWINRYFDLFSGINRDMSTSEKEAAYNERELGKQRELANKVIDFAIELGQDLSSLDLDGMQRPNSPNHKQADRATSNGSPSQGISFAPLYSIKDDATIFQVILELPGVDIRDVNLELDKKTNVVVISGCRSSLVSSGDTIPFSESFEMGPDVDTEKITASLDKGILTVSAPKQERSASSTHRVPIVSGN